MPELYKGHEFEALKCRFEDQTEQLYRMTLIDLRIFTSYITLQLVLGAWLATHGSDISNIIIQAGLMIIDLVLASIAAAFLYNNFMRRKEVVGTVNRCNLALGYETDGVYLEGLPLNMHTKTRLWAKMYFAGIVVGVFGIALILFYRIF